jgi:hypothetical protein
MALKITTQIETDKGNTSEAYIRIINYMINKYGTASFFTETFLNQEASQGNYSSIQSSIAKNDTIGDMFYVSLKNEQGNVDLSEVTTQDIFTFGYIKLKGRLTEIYGAENIIDC